MLRITMIVLAMTVAVFADEPTSKPALARVEAARSRLEAARMAAFARVKDDYQAAVVDRNLKEGILANARVNGTPQERVDASRDFNKATNAVAAVEARAAADPAVKAARNELDQAQGMRRLEEEKEQEAAELERTKATRQAIAEAEARSRELARKEEEERYLGPPIEEEGIAVRVSSPVAGPVPCESLGRPVQSDPHLAFSLEISNKTDGKKGSYKTWAGSPLGLGSKATLRDNLGNYYRQIDFGFGSKIIGRVEDASIYPGKSIEDVIVFETPIDKAASFDLELPGENVGWSRPIKYHFDASRVRQR